MRNPARTLRALASMAGRGPGLHRLRRQPYHAALAEGLFERGCFDGGFDCSLTGLGAILTSKGLQLLIDLIKLFFFSNTNS